MVGKECVCVSGGRGVYSGDNLPSPPLCPCLQRIDAQRQSRQSSLQQQVRERNAAQLKTWEQTTATQLTEQQRLKHHERVKQLQVCISHG